MFTDTDGGGGGGTAVVRTGDDDGLNAGITGIGGVESSEGIIVVFVVVGFESEGLVLNGDGGVIA